MAELTPALRKAFQGGPRREIRLDGWSPRSHWEECEAAAAAGLLERGKMVVKEEDQYSYVPFTLTPAGQKALSLPPGSPAGQTSPSLPPGSPEARERALIERTDKWPGIVMPLKSIHGTERGWIDRRCLTRLWRHGVYGPVSIDYRELGDLLGDWSIDHGRTADP